MPATPERPNILYLHSHDTGRYIAPYGHAVATPQLQRLAAQGVLFRQAFCAAPTCSPSRASLLTGQAPHTSGMFGLAHRGFALHDYRQHLLHTLRSAGYYAALCGVQHIAADAGTIGYDAWHEQDHRRSSTSIAEAAAGFLNNTPPQPFFLSVGFDDTHREFPAAGPEDDPRYCAPPPTLPDTPRTRQDMAAYKTSARRLDAAVGRVLQALNDSALAENTLVIYTTDHGIAFPAMKCNLTDHGIGVSLIMRGPGGFGGGRVIDAMLSHIDIFPTICDLLDITPPEWLQGRSLLPLIRREAAEINEAIFAEVTYHAAYEPMRAIRTPRWKYIRRFGERTAPVLPNIDDSPSKAVWLEQGWGDRPVPARQLYDLLFDPQEQHNLATDPAYQSTLEALEAQLTAWMAATGDPLLDGPVPAPRGAELNDPGGVSPAEPTIIVT